MRVYLYTGGYEDGGAPYAGGGAMVGGGINPPEDGGMDGGYARGALDPYPPDDAPYDEEPPDDDPRYPPDDPLLGP